MRDTPEATINNLVFKLIQFNNTSSALLILSHVNHYSFV